MKEPPPCGRGLTHWYTSTVGRAPEYSLSPEFRDYKLLALTNLKDRTATPRALARGGRAPVLHRDRLWVLDLFFRTAFHAVAFQFAPPLFIWVWCALISFPCSTAPGAVSFLAPGIAVKNVQELLESANGAI